MNTSNQVNISDLRKDRKVIKGLTDYLKITQKTLDDVLSLMSSDNQDISVLGKDGNSSIRSFNGGYNAFSIPKASGGKRIITEPAPQLKEIQHRLNNTILSQIPISSAVTGGEKGTSAKNNAQIHVPNKFLYVTDIRNAYPSTSSDRINKNLSGALRKQIEMSFAHFSDQEKSRFIDLITFLTTHNGQLPQGAPTSSHLLNIVFSKTDTEIMQLIHDENTNIEKPVYSRYIDDISVSFKCYQSFLDAWKPSRKIGKDAENLADTWSLNSENRKKDLDKMNKTIEGLLDISYVVNDPSEKEHLRENFLNIKKKLKKLKIYAEHSKLQTVEGQLYSNIGMIDSAISILNKKDVEKGMEHIKYKVNGVIKKNGWEVHPDKCKTYAPGPVHREITGITIDNQGRMGLNKKKMQKYIDLVKTCAYESDISNFPSEFVDKTGNIDEHKVGYTLQGIRNYILDVKGRTADKFEVPYQDAKKRFFGAWKERGRGYNYSEIK
ncbi:MAG: hypothetical protein GY828_02480 [Candidatus Gracilibacteria bacterium]|nr:hypothetical protein [Candidatus Gracilibacteria bacterium]